MKIEVVGKIEWSDLEKKLREVTLKKKDDNGNDIFIYRNANIQLRQGIDSKEVNPTTFYLLRKNIDIQRFLHNELLKQGINTYDLNGAYEIRNGDNIFTLTPPIIEVTPRFVQYVPKDGELKIDDKVNIHIPVINDGAHRVYDAKTAGSKFTGIWISGADPKYPFYAHPNDWSQVNIFDDTPKTKAEKKYYSREDCYGLYRDFEPLGCGAPRGVGNSGTGTGK